MFPGICGITAAFLAEVAVVQVRANDRIAAFVAL
jgi:hypothetical protein